MLRFYLRLLLIPFFLFSAALLVVHAQTYNDDDLRQLLLPEGCPAPCFMDIRPGVTTMDEALQILKANVWVGKVNYETASQASNYITWTWSDQKPRWIIGNDRGEIRVRDNLVNTMTIYTDIPLGDTRLVLGLPEVEIVAPGQVKDGFILLYMAFYWQRGLMFENWQRCNAMEPLRNKVMIKVNAASSTAVSRPINSIKDLYHGC